jgi:hypothetical protein
MLPPDLSSYFENKDVAYFLSHQLFGCTKAPSVPLEPEVGEIRLPFNLPKEKWQHKRNLRVCLSCLSTMSLLQIMGMSPNHRGFDTVILTGSPLVCFVLYHYSDS